MLQIDSFVSITFPRDPAIWKTRFSPTGALRQNLLENYQTHLPPYFSEEDKKHFVETFGRNGFDAPTCWYKMTTSQMSAKDDQRRPYHYRAGCLMTECCLIRRDPGRTRVPACQRTDLLRCR